MPPPPPPDAPAQTTNLLTRSTLNLRRHAQGHPHAAHAAARDAALAAESAPHLPAPWLALFSACHAAADFQGARDALTEGLRYCPFDQALQLLAAAAKSPLSQSPSIQQSSIYSSQSPSRRPPIHPSPPSPTTPTPAISLQSNHRPPTRTRSRTLVHQHLLRAAEESALKGRHDEAIAKYTTIISAVPPSATEHASLRALSRRSDAWLKKAVAEDDPRCFDSAIADASQLVSVAPQWDEAWLRLGTAHLENGCPARARHCFLKGLQHCPQSTRLPDGLRDSQFVIEDEGNETDWEDDDQHTNDQIIMSNRHRNKIHATDSNNATPSDSTTEPHRPHRLTQTPQFATPRSQPVISENPAFPRVRSENTPRANPRQDYDAAPREVQSLRSTDFNQSAAESDHQSLSSRFRFSRQVSRNAAVERLGQARPDGGPRSAQWDHLPSYLQTTREALAAESSPTQGAFSDPLAGSSAALGKQRKLYDVLGVPHQATDVAIRKSYFQLARRYHPDKNADDDDATVKFQKVAEAYAVLSDPETRAIYDRDGDRGLAENSVDMVDPSTLFAMVFGSEQFVHLIGELQLASLATNVDDDGIAPTEAVLNNIQKARVGKLVLEMVKILKPWVDGDKRGFLKSTSQMMRHLRNASFGPELLHTVGSVYVQQTAYLQDKSRPFNLSAVMRKATLRSHKISSHHKAMSAAGKVMEKQRKLHDRVMRSGRDHRFISGEEARNIAVEMAGNAIDMMWKISVIDIETTLEDVLLIVLSGRDLIAEGDYFTFPEPISENIGQPDKGRHRRRLHSYLGSREPRDQRERGRDAVRLDAGLVRPIAPLSHGEPAISRQQILSERAHGIQAMGRIFMSAKR